MNTPEPTPDTAPDTGSPRLARTAAGGRVYPWAALYRGAAPVTGTALALAAEVLRLRALLDSDDLLPSSHSYRLADDDAPTDLREALATYAHEAWAGWMRDLFFRSTSTADGSVVIPAALVARWTQQCATAYADLPAAGQAWDRAEADQMLAIMAQPGPGVGA